MPHSSPAGELPTTSPFQRGVVACVVREGRFLVVRRSEWVAAPLWYGFPGGGLEPGETAEAALVRELHEELAVPCQPQRRLWTCTAAWGVTLEWWLAVLPPSAQLAPNPREVRSVHWLTAEECLALPELLPTNHDFFAAWRREEFDLRP